jgi:hypothetical protein
MRLTLLRLGRAATLASAIIAASGLLEIARMPLFAAVGEIALNLAAARSEAEKLRSDARDRMRSAHRARQVPSPPSGLFDVTRPFQ